MIKTVVDILPISAHWFEWRRNPVPFDVEIINEHGHEKFKEAGHDGYCTTNFRYLDGREWISGCIYGALLEDKFPQEPDWEV
jgi:hypothetical protein